MKILDKGQTPEKLGGQVILDFTKAIGNDLKEMAEAIIVNTPNMWFENKDKVEEISEELVTMRLRLKTLSDWLDNFGDVLQDACDLLEA